MFSKRFLYVCLLTFVSFPLAAYNDFFDQDSWALQADVTSQSGTVYTRVFYGSHKLSQLEWDLKHIPIGSLQGTYRYNSSTRWYGVLWSRLLNEGQGKIIDRDWIDLNNPTVQTHHSAHNAPLIRAHGYHLHAQTRLHKTQAATLITPFANQWQIYIPKCKINGLVGYKNTLYRWRAHGGTLNYPEGVAVIANEVNGLFLEQEARAPFAGLGVRFKAPVGTFEITGTGSLFSTISLLDKHYLRELITESTFHLAQWYTLGIDYFYPLTKHLQLHLGYMKDWMPNQRGDSIIRTETTITEHANISGVAHNISHYTLGLRQKF